ncbi:hypothetical protein DFH09DRAFT_1087481 [Mycena vulgaris]|nr:hypothetical protein DFH09DRAFT_1106580 [Mycena vulgaris]KAJ6548022.1 hypothetical protein DFH09DRAFT_1087481 [Mycena vulgaris]
MNVHNAQPFSKPLNGKIIVNSYSGSLGRWDTVTTCLPMSDRTYLLFSAHLHKEDEQITYGETLKRYGENIYNNFCMSVDQSIQKILQVPVLKIHKSYLVILPVLSYIPPTVRTATDIGGTAAVLLLPPLLLTVAALAGPGATRGRRRRAGDWMGGVLLVDFMLENGRRREGDEGGGKRKGGLRDGGR